MRMGKNQVHMCGHNTNQKQFDLSVDINTTATLHCTQICDATERYKASTSNQKFSKLTGNGSVSKYVHSPLQWKF